MKKTIPQVLQDNARSLQNEPAQLSKDAEGNFQPITFGQLYSQVQEFAAGIIEIGAKRKDNIGIISENRQEWLVADIGIQSIGAVDVPRGVDTMPQELAYILDFSECSLTILENMSQLIKLESIVKEIPKLKQVIILENDFEKDKVPRSLKKLKIHLFQDILSMGKKALEKNPDLVNKEIEQGKPDDLATLIYTSGTTGEPKGVMLSHWNFLTQALHLDDKISIGPGDKWLCVLPVWHAYERVMQYISIANGCALAYSKPIGPVMLADFEKVNPTWMASVPRIWESIRTGVIRKVNNDGGIKKILFHYFLAIGKAYRYFFHMLTGRLPRYKVRIRILDILIAIIPLIFFLPGNLLGSVLVFKKIRARLGKNFKAGITGGGALPTYVDSFFSAAGINLLEGYGLTETAPVVAVRTQWSPVISTIGTPIYATETKVVDEKGNELKAGQKGVLLIRGPQVMLGYYKKEDATKQMIDSEGWLNSGDLARKTLSGEIKIMGREKDTIVLMGGENIEPAPMEEHLRESMFIDHAVVLGQDQKNLACIVTANEDSVQAFAKEHNLGEKPLDELVKLPKLQEKFKEEIAGTISSRNGFKVWERISNFHVLGTPFEVGQELSGKQEVKRHFINEKYKKEIKAMFK
jgi:long-chain acyl-CoA synthetase